MTAERGKLAAVRALVVVVAVAGCGGKAAESPREMCERIHPELVASLTKTMGEGVRGDAREEFVEACAKLPVEFLRCHLDPGDGCVEQLGNMELESKLTAPLLARGEARRPAPPAAEVAEPVVQGIYDRVKAALLRPGPTTLPDFALVYGTIDRRISSKALCGGEAPDGEAEVVLAGAVVAAKVHEEDDHDPFPYGRVPGNDGLLILQLPGVDVSVTATARVTQRCGARTIEASAPVSMTVYARPDLVIGVDGTEPLRFRPDRIQPGVRAVNEGPKVGAVKGASGPAAKEIAESLGRTDLWIDPLSNGLAAAPATDAFIRGACAGR